MNWEELEKWCEEEGERLFLAGLSFQERSQYRAKKHGITTTAAWYTHPAHAIVCTCFLDDGCLIHGQAASGGSGVSSPTD